jgi:hypothetical protein
MAKNSGTAITAIIGAMIIIPLFILVINLTSDSYNSTEYQTVNNSNSSEFVLYNGSDLLLNADRDKTKNNFEITSLSIESGNDTYLKFNGGNDYIDTRMSPSMLNYSTTSFSMCLWFKTLGISTVDTTTYQHLIGTYPGTSPETRIIYDETEKKVSFTTRNSTTYKTYGSNSTNFSQWTFVCGIVNRDSGNQSLYLNGNMTNTNPYTLGDIQANSSNITIGGSSKKELNIAGWFYGYLDEVRIYNRSLLDAEITQIHNSGRVSNSSLTDDGLILWYPLDEYNGTTIYNVANTSNNGIIYGT